MNFSRSKARALEKKRSRHRTVNAWNYLPTNIVIFLIVNKILLFFVTEDIQNKEDKKAQLTQRERATAVHV